MLSGKPGFILVMVVIILVALLLTTSRAGIVAAFAGCLTLVLLQAVRGRNRGVYGTVRFAGLAVAGVLFLLVLELSGGVFAERILSVDQDAGNRFDVYRMTWSAIGDNAWTGTGLGTFQDIFPLYRDDVLVLGQTWGQSPQRLSRNPGWIGDTRRDAFPHCSVHAVLDRTAWLLPPSQGQYLQRCGRGRLCCRRPAQPCRFQPADTGCGDGVCHATGIGYGTEPEQHVDLSCLVDDGEPILTVLVTGGAGYIGSHMVWELTDSGDKVVVIDNLTTGFDWLLPGHAELVLGDVGDAELVDNLLRAHRIDAVIHFAGSIIVPESVDDPLKYYRNNTLASLTLIDACIRRGVRDFVFSSTAAVYGDPESVPVAEAAQLKPVSPYGRSKMMTELMLADTATAHDFRYCALRYFNVAGADPGGRSGQSTAEATHLIKVACEAALGKRDGLTIFGDDYGTPDGTAIRDYIHVTDLVAAHRLALDYLRSGGKSRAMNCGYGRGFSVQEVVERVKAVSGVDFDVRHAGRRPGDSEAVIADPSQIRGTLDWQPWLRLISIRLSAMQWHGKRSSPPGTAAERSNVTHAVIVAVPGNESRYAFLDRRCWLEAVVAPDRLNVGIGRLDRLPAASAAWSFPLRGRARSPVPKSCASGLPAGCCRYCYTR